MDFLIIPKTTQPLYFGLSPEPRHLPLGIVAMSLLRGCDRGFLVALTADHLQRLLVSKRVQCGSIAVLLQELFGLLHQPTREHLLCPHIDAIIERLSIGIQTDPQD